MQSAIHSSNIAPCRSRRAAFTLLEFIVAFAILSILMVMLFGAVTPVTKAWIDGERRIESHQRARGALELMTRELTPAVVDTRMQFVVMPGEVLGDAGAALVAGNSLALVWMAPLGTDGELRCVGYYLYRDDERRFFRLKRIFIRPRPKDGSSQQNRYFPRLVNPDNTRDLSMRTDPVSARWFLDRWDEEAFAEEDPNNRDVIVSTAADGVLAFWVQCYDLLGNPVPWLSESDVHPSSDLMYNSAAYFHMATTEPFDDGSTTVYLAHSPQVMKGNRVPSAVEITIVTIDDTIAAEDWQVPEVQTVLGGDGALDMEASVRLFLDELKESNIQNAEVFSTKVKLVNGT